MRQDASPLDDDGAVYSRFASEEDFGELLREFVGAMPQKQHELRQLLAAGRISELRAFAHQLKGAGGGYGFRELSVLAAALEDACRAGEEAAIAGRAVELLDHMGRIRV